MLQRSSPRTQEDLKKKGGTSVVTENSTQSTQQGDVLEIARQQARQRHNTLEAHLDPGTIRIMETLGISEGWRCLEVGAGGGSIASWLCGRVGPTGRVVATDIDTQFLESIKMPNLEVRQHDIATEDPPGEGYDLVHARWVLAYLRDRPAMLRRLLGAVKQGGWLMVEEPDFGNRRNASPLYREIQGMEPFGGRRLYPEMRRLALREIGLEARMTMLGQPDQYLLAGAITETNVTDQIDLLDHSVMVFAGPITFTTWGRKR
jgi:2-polyprenyl-3-methyl-5-hydroxy-6-metoxy-1,4-benzoquinol methylase